MSDRLVLKGDNTLQGTVSVSGAKNSALPLLASSLLTDRPLHLENVPGLKDVATMLEMIGELGKKVESPSPNSYIISGKVDRSLAPAELVQKMRASFLVLAPLLARTGRAQVALPGGCTIGSRPIDLHLKNLVRLGAEIHQEDGKIEARANRLRGEEIFLDYPSVGATEQLIMGAALAEGRTVIHNPAREPEIDDLISLLNEMGAGISLGRCRLKIEGKEKLSGARHTVIPDRIEAGTYVLAVCATGGDVRIEDLIPRHLQALLVKLKEAGMKMKEGENHLTLDIEKGSRPASMNVKTLPYPGFPTDLQAPVSALLSLGKGKSVINETVFDGRTDHVPELSKMGADIAVADSNTIFVNGTEKLQGARVEAPDIRAGASLIIAGLAAEGQTTVTDLKHIDRGYENIADKLAALGARVRRVS